MTTETFLLKSTDFRQVFSPVPSPTAMYDRDGQLYLYDFKQGLFVFDYYGGKKNTLQMLQLSDLQVIDKNTITARDSTHIICYINPQRFRCLLLKLLITTQSSKKSTLTEANFIALRKMENWKFIQYFKNSRKVIRRIWYQALDLSATIVASHSCTANRIASFPFISSSVSLIHFYPLTIIRQQSSFVCHL